MIDDISGPFEALAQCRRAREDDDDSEDNEE